MVSERDTEIVGDEVKRAIGDEVVSLDTNSFAHLWKDGISSSSPLASARDTSRDAEQSEVPLGKRQIVIDSPFKHHGSIYEAN